MTKPIPRITVRKVFDLVWQLVLIAWFAIALLATVFATMGIEGAPDLLADHRTRAFIVALACYGALNGFANWREICKLKAERDSLHATLLAERGATTARVQAALMDAGTIERLRARLMRT